MFLFCIYVCVYILYTLSFCTDIETAFSLDVQVDRDNKAISHFILFYKRIPLCV